MSLHAQLSPEAEARLRAQQRNSTITSIIISILSVVLIGILLLWILLPTVETFTRKSSPTSPVQKMSKKSPNGK